MAEKETLSLNKCPDKTPKRTTLLAPQPLPLRQPHALVSDGFTVKAMMKNSVVSDLPALNARSPSQGTPGYRGGRPCPAVCAGPARLLERICSKGPRMPILSTFLITRGC